MGFTSLAKQVADQYGLIVPAITKAIPVPQAPGSTQPFFRALKFGMTNSDVRKLQIFLNTHGFAVANTGAGSPGHETTYFGPATKAALMKFQLAHKKETLDPQGLNGPTGFFGMDTMKAVNGMLK
jgi:peptidoglycan hydrolase-like protein with peptidoglycan-binding domain